jgi:hypothetical protein
MAPRSPVVDPCPGERDRLEEVISIPGTVEQQQTAGLGGRCRASAQQDDLDAIRLQHEDEEHREPLEREEHHEQATSSTEAKIVINIVGSGPAGSRPGRGRDDAHREREQR